jgi:hypothetical protein
MAAFLKHVPYEFVLSGANALRDNAVSSCRGPLPLQEFQCCPACAGYLPHFSLTFWDNIFLIAEI